MAKVKNEFLPRPTDVHHENHFELSPHYFTVKHGDEVLQQIDFQNGPIKEHGVNGVTEEDLIDIVRTRLKAFNQTEFGCRENAVALTKLDEAMLWLNKRTMERQSRKVEGTSEK